MDFHDFDGFGIHLPGLIVTEQGTAIAVCQRRHDSMGDAGHESDILASRSDDGGESICEFGEHDDLADQKKHCGLIRCEESLLFSHPSAVDPTRDIVIHLSPDGGRTWPISQVLHHGPSRYSDPAVNGDGSILCIYTHGQGKSSGENERRPIQPGLDPFGWLKRQLIARKRTKTPDSSRSASPASPNDGVPVVVGEHVALRQR